MVNMEEQGLLFYNLFAWLFEFAQWLTTLGEWLTTPLTFGGNAILPIEFTITPMALILGAGLIAVIVVAIFKTFFKWI